jgi:hypothetical protein
LPNAGLNDCAGDRTFDDGAQRTACLVGDDLAPRLGRQGPFQPVSGVASVGIGGSQKYAVRVDVDPRQLTAHGIGIDEVANAISSANVNLPTGTIYGAQRSLDRMPAGDRGPGNLEAAPNVCARGGRRRTGGAHLAGAPRLHQVVPTRPSVANRVTHQVTLGRSVCQRTGNRANSGDFEAEGRRMAVILKSTAFWGPPYSGRIGGVSVADLPGDRPAPDAAGHSRRDGAGRPADDQPGDA